MRQLLRYRITRAALIVPAAVVLLLTGCGSQQADAPPPLVHTYDQSSDTFTVQYPDGWDYSIPMQNVMVLDTPTHTGGPSVTIQRSLTLTSSSLSASLNTYLLQGPLFPNKNWSVLGEITTSKFQGREAVTVDLRGSDLSNQPEQRTHILMTQALNRIVYVVVLTAPSGQWEQQHTLLENIMNSVKIVE